MHQIKKCISLSQCSFSSIHFSVTADSHLPIYQSLSVPVCLHAIYLLLRQSSELYYQIEGWYIGLFHTQIIIRNVCKTEELYTMKENIYF